MCCALAVVCVAGCYRPNVVAGPVISEGAGAAAHMQAAALQGLRLHVFNTGMNRVSPLLVGSPAPWRSAPAFVIEHPVRGLIVFDCGLAEEVGREGEASLHPVTRLLFKTRSLPGKDLVSQMRAAGLDPGDVAYVILSHMHFDHVGAAPAFTNASFIAGPGARANSVSRMNGFDPERIAWVDADAWHEADFSRGEPFATFDSTLDVFSDGSLRLIRGGGHTAGGIAVLLNLPAGPVLLAGDLVVHFDWLRSDDVQRIVLDA